LSLPVWLIAGAALVIFLISSVALYSKGEMKHYFTITGLMLGSYLISIATCFAAVTALGTPDSLVLSGLNLSANIGILIIPALISILAIKLFVSLKPSSKTSTVKPKEEKQLTIEVSIEEKQPSPEEKTEEPHIVASLEVTFEKEPAKETVEETKEEIFFEDIMDSAPPKQEVPEPVVEESEPEVFFEDIAPVDFAQPKAPEPVVEATPVVEQKPIERAPAPVETISEEISPLEDLPTLEGSLDDLGGLFEQPTPAQQQEKIEVKAQEVEIAPEVVQPVEIKIQQEPEQSHFHSTPSHDPSDKPFIPRLAEESKSKVVEGSGKITSIGKLLVDHRDIENIIETNALMQSVGAETTATKIISAMAGSKVNDKLTAIKEIEGINDCIVVSEAGFIQASTLKDLHKEQIMGAMAANVFSIIALNLNKLGFQPPKDIAFESESGMLGLNRLNSMIIGTFVDPKKPLYDTGIITEILPTLAEMGPEDLLDSVTALNGLLGAVLSNSNGELIVSKLVDASKNEAQIAELLPTFYSNMGVFVKNMSIGSLRKAIIRTGNEVLFFTSLGSNILMLYFTLNGTIQPKETKIQYETIISS
jgi:predicted regulator of Ras-like GTPase activity (Roadblock/LC7/MglB family)